MYYLYILKSIPADKYYVGVSSDPATRLDMHNNPIFDKYTAKYIPWEFAAVFEIENGSKSTALKIEKFIKQQKSRVFIEKLIASKKPFTGILSQLKKLSDC